jgi:hypothetical protein
MIIQIVDNICRTKQFTYICQSNTQEGNMFLKGLYSIFISLLISSLFFTSCKFKKEDFQDLKIANYTPEWGLSLVKSDIYLSKALDKVNSSTTKFFVTTENGAMTLNYTDTVDIAKGEDFFSSITNFKAKAGIEVGAVFATTVTNLPVGSSTPKNSIPEVTSSFPLQIDHVGSYSRILIQSGTLIMSGSSKVRHDVNFDVEFTSITRNGQVLTKNFNFQYLGGSNFPTIANVSNEDMAGYKIIPTTGTPNIPFTIKNITVTKLNNDAPPSGNTVHANDSLSISFAFSDLRVQEMDAKDVNYQTIIPSADEGKVTINIFDNSQNNGEVHVKNPSVTMKAYNEMPLTTNLKIDTIAFNYSKSGKTTLLNNFSTPNKPINTDPSNTFIINAKNTSNPDVFIVNGSEVASALEKSPNSLTVNFKKVVLTSPSNQTVTIKSSDRMRMSMNVKLPLEGFVNGFVISDTSTVDQMPKTGVVERMEITLFSDNFYPIEIGFTAYFLDTTKNSLPLFQLPRKGEENTVLAASTQGFKKSYSISKAEYDGFQLEKTAKIVLRGTFDTRPTSQDVKITLEQHCLLQLVGKVKFNYDLNDPDGNLNTNSQ